jgi:Sulfotransferase family
VNLFIQGMRRSGTTILFDALLEDPELRCFYEPLREQGETVGGGSGAREIDAFAETRALREEFARDRYPDVPIDEFNWGGPRLPDVELDQGLPPHSLDLLRHLLGLAPQVAIKETRFYCKVPVLAELDPEAALVHVVRDPRAVCASIMLGRGRRRARKLRTADDFFEARSDRKLWSSRRLSELILERRDYRDIADPPDFLRVLVVWKETFERTWEEGRRLFGDRYLLLRNEDLRADPGAAIGRLYDLLGRSLPEGVAAWAADNVRAPEDVYAADDPRWSEVFGTLGMSEAVTAAGYPPALDRVAR